MVRDLLVGAHMSIAGGIHNAFNHGTRAGCRTLQIFLKNSNRWKGKALTAEDRERYAAAQRRTGIRPVVAHSSYLINLASPDRALHARSVAALVEELERANFLGVSALILHPGAHMGAGEAEGMRRVMAGLNRAMGQAPPPVRILLESTAGQGTSLGHTFEQLAAMLEKVRDEARVGICLDTCHLFAAGYDLRTEEGYRQTMRRFHQLIGRERIQVFHVNDCKKELGSRVDRHAHIGKGFIGLEGFRCLVNDRRFARVPKILETPKGPDLAEDIENLATLRSLLESRRQLARCDIAPLRTRTG